MGRQSSFARALEAGQKAVGKNTRVANKVDEFRALSDADQDAFRMGVADELSARLERIKDTAQGEAGAVANKVVGSDAERRWLMRCLAMRARCSLIF